MKLLAVFLVFAIGCCAAKSVEGPRRAMIQIQGADVNGKLMMEQASINSPVKIRGVIYGMEPGLHGVHIHTSESLGSQCENVGKQLIRFESRDSERLAGHLGNVKTFSGTPSRTDINLISSLVSLYEESNRSILDRSLAIHALPDDLTYVNAKDARDLPESHVLACGLIRQTEAEGIRSYERESILLGLERPYKVDKIEQGILHGEKSWENVRHPYFGAEGQKVPSNLNLEGLERPDLSVDALTLESAVPTHKVWMAGYTYEYDYAGYISTGIMGISPKLSGGSIKGRLTIEPVDESLVTIALLNTKAKQFNEDVMNKFIETDPGHEVHIVDQEYLEKPFQVKFAAGKVESVAISRDEPLWIVNFKRALAAQIQFQFDGASGVFQQGEYDNYYAENTVYHAMEGCSSGECQTWYHISRIPAEQIEAEAPKLLPVPELCQNYPVYEIVKNRDFDKCRVLPIYNYQNVPTTKCNLVRGEGCENAMSRVDTVRIIGCTNQEGQFIVQRIKTVDKLTTKPFGYETEATEGQTIQHFHLKSVHRASSSKLQSRISSDVHVYQTLAYSYDSDYQTQGPLMGKPTLRHINSPMVIEVDKQTLFKEAERLFSEIYQQLESESFYLDPSTKYIPEKISMLSKVFANFDYPELSQFVGKYFQSSSAASTKSQVLVDALVLAGSNPAFVVLRDYILKGQISGEQAVQAISLLPGTIQTPTKELFSSFYELLKSEVVQSHRQLKITSALAVSRLVYQACVNTTHSLNMYPKLVMGEFCNPSDSIVSSQLVPWLAEQVKTASDAGERMAFLTALGNVGHEMIVPFVKPYITSCEPSTHYENEWYERNQRDLVNLSKKEMRKKWIQAKQTMNLKNLEQEDEYTTDAEQYEDQALCNLVRTKAIFALSALAAEQEEIVGTLLMPIFFNKAEETEVRLAALALLFVSQPPQAFYTRVALSTWYEPNDQIAHFIYTTIASKVANQNELNREEAFKAESVMPLMKPMFWTSHSAVNYQKAGYAQKVRLGYVAKTTTFPGFESFIPSHYYNNFQVAFGPYVSKFFEFAFDSKHAEKFIDRLLGKPGLRMNNKDESSIFGAELERIQQDLKIEARATGQPELYIYLNFFDNYQRFYTVNTQSIMQTIEKQVMQKLRQSSGDLSVNYSKYVPLFNNMRRVPSSMGLAYSVVNQASAFVSFRSVAKLNLERSPFAGFQGTIQPVFQLSVIHKVLGETPFARSYPAAGVHYGASVAAPGNFAIEADFKTGKFQTSFEFLGSRPRIAQIGVLPFTTIRKVGDFSPFAFLKDTQIVSPNQQPQQEKHFFGQQALGLSFVFEQQGDALAFKAPQAYAEDFFGTVFFAAAPSTVRHYNQSLFLDNTQSQTKSIKTFFSFAAKSDSQFDSQLNQHLHSQSLFDTVYGDYIKGGQYVKQQTNEWDSQKFQHVFKTLSNPSGYSFDFTVEFTPKSSSVQARRIGSSIAYGMDTQSHRGSLMMEKRGQLQGEENFVFCAEFEGQFPDNLVFKRKELIKDETERQSYYKIGFGKSCTDDRKISIATKWTHSEEASVAKTLQAKWEQDQCQQHQELHGNMGMSDECVAARRQSAYLNKGVTVINYNEMPAFVYNATFKASNLVRHFLGAYMSDNQVNVQNTKGQITIESTYYPLAGSLDVKVFKPFSNTFFRGLDIHPVAEVVLPKRMAVPQSVLAAPGVCLIGSETVTTYDGLHYNATLSGCDQLLTKDCSGRYKFAVLSREENDKKVVTVLLNKEKIELFPAQQKVKVNGMDISISSESYIVKNEQNQILAVIKKTADNFVEVDSPVSHMVRVLTDAKEVVVLASPLHRGRLCGLCGTQDGDKTSDLTGPRQCSIPRDLMDAAYELKHPAGCKSEISSSEVSEVRRIQQECQQQKSETVFGISKTYPLLPKFQQTVLSSQTFRRPSQLTVYRNKMVVQDNKRCFSTESVPKCVEGSQPVDTVEKKLGFHCVSKNILSDKLSEELFVRPLDELQGKQVDIIRVFNVPTACIPY